MYHHLYEVFEKLDTYVDGRNEPSYSIDRFTIAFYEARLIVETQLIPELARLSLLQAFTADVFGLFSASLKSEIRALQVELHEQPEDKMARLIFDIKMESLIPQTAVSDFHSMMEYTKANFLEYTSLLEIYDNIYSRAHGCSGEEFISQSYHWFRIGFMLYWRWRDELCRSAFIDQKASIRVEAEYAEIGIDLTTTDPQFSKYRLLSINPQIIIMNNKDSRTLVDSRIQKHFWINVPRRLMFALEELSAQKLISKIAFNVTQVTDMVPIMEEMERGKKLKITVSDLPAISRFYSTEAFEDGLSILHDKEKCSLTFEEVMKDFRIVGDNIVTQVVHLEYSETENGTYINHLDHEFIAYTLDEYDARLKDVNTKGSAGKVKSFKIDGAEIPLAHKFEGDWFLLVVLDAYFQNHALIQEIFEDFGQTTD